MQIDTNILISGIVSIIIAILGSQWFASWIQNHNSKSIRTEINSIQSEIGKMKTSEELREIKNTRRRILRFNDELLNSIDHSKEYFDEIVSDIDDYRRFTNSHPDYSNGKANLACENIERVYRNCLEKKTFL
jgi:predicted nucleic acid-binding protein